MEIKERIRGMQSDAQGLERLYRQDKGGFKAAFNAVYPEMGESGLLQAWHARLNQESEELKWGSRREIWLVILLALGAGLLTQFPDLFSLEKEQFFSQQISFIVFPFLSAYFLWKRGASQKTWLVAGGVFLVTLGYVHWLPFDQNRDSVMLALIHVPFLLWSVFGFSYLGGNAQSLDLRTQFLRFNGDLAVFLAVMGIAGMMTAGMTAGLFDAIGYDVEALYLDHVVVMAAAATPMLVSYLLQHNPALVSRISPMVARIFSPLVLGTLLIYLPVLAISGKNLYEDREFLILFNLLLVGVMALVLFSVVETAKGEGSRFQRIVLSLLASVTILVNAIALSAILYRISSWGITPNRLAVLGSNILILVNLILVAIQLWRSVLSGAPLAKVAVAIVRYLPLYTLWTIIVVLIFPMIFSNN